MQNPLEVTFHDLDRTEEMETLIQEKFENVLQISPDITKCHITVEKLSNHHQSANKACVRLDLKAPHIKDIIVSEKCDEDQSALKTFVIKVFKRAKLLLREEVGRRRDSHRAPKDESFQSPNETEDDFDELDH